MLNATDQPITATAQVIIKTYRMIIATAQSIIETYQVKTATAHGYFRSDNGQLINDNG